MTGPVVRPVAAADYAAIARLTVAAYQADGQLSGADEGRYADVLSDVAARAAVAEVLVAVSGISGAVLGSVTFVLPGTPYAELSGAGEAEFRMLAVDPSAQRTGAGEALVRACVARARELGCSSLLLCTRDFSAPAHRLYTRLGFVRMPERDWAPMPGVNLLAMRLTFG
jgi:ribosomal protein S18 acetylase RimI-like enzyme